MDRLRIARRGRWGRLLAEVALAWLVAPSAARAEDALGDATLTARASARAAMTRGDAAFEEGRYAEALEAYRAADRVMNVPTTAFARGRAELALGRLVEAEDSLLRAVRHATSGSEPAAFQAARGGAAELLRALAPRLPSLDVAVSPVAAPATVSVDGVEVPVVGGVAVLRLDPGAHRLTVAATGYEPAVGTVEMREGQRRRLASVLAPSFGLTSIPTATRVAGGIAVAGVLVGGVTGILSLIETESLLAKCSGGVCPSTLASRYDRAYDLARASNVGFATSAAAVAAGLLTFATWPERPRSSLRLEVGAGRVDLRVAF